MRIETVTLLVGLVALVTTLVTAFMSRRTPPPVPELSRWRAGDGTLPPPPDQTPASVHALTVGEVTSHDIRLSLLDLASRGYLHIDMTSGPKSDGWSLRRTDKQLSSALHDHEWFLLSGPFSDALGNPRTCTWAELRDDSGRPIHQAQRLLTEEMRRRRWIPDEKDARHSVWAWTGSVVLLLGIVTTGYMLVDWLATSHFNGVLGGAALTTAGVVLVSRGRRHAPLDADGLAAQQACLIWRDQLRTENLNDTPINKLADAFGRKLVWQLAYDDHAGLVAGVDAELVRAERWSQQVSVVPRWLTATEGTTPSELVDQLVDFLAGSRHQPLGERKRLPRPRRKGK